MVFFIADHVSVAQLDVTRGVVICLVGGTDGDLPVAIFVGGKALENNKAGDLVREVAKVLGGGGGGRPNMANGRGRFLDKFPEAIFTLKGLIK